MKTITTIKEILSNPLNWVLILFITAQTINLFI